MNFLQNIWADIKGFFSKEEEAVVAFVSALIHNIAQNGGQVLMDAATAAVTAAENTGGTAAVKFAAAQASITATLVAEGAPVIMSAVNAAIEAAVSALSSTQQKTLAVPVVSTTVAAGA